MASDSDNQLVEDFVNKRKELILQLYESKGLKASGLSGRLLHVNQNNNVSQLVDKAGYFEFEEFGRSPGNAPPFKKIYDWLAFQKYGLTWKDEAQRRSLAWAILMKIKKQGTYTYRTKKPTGVLSEAINRQSLEELVKNLIAKKSSEIKTDITRLFE